MTTPYKPVPICANDLNEVEGVLTGANGLTLGEIRRALNFTTPDDTIKACLIYLCTQSPTGEYFALVKVREVRA